MKCPRCGADNTERAERCYLCEYSFATSGEAGEPPTPEEHVRPQYPPPGVQAGVVPPGQQPVQPPPVPGAGYQTPPPGAYPAGYAPPPAAGGPKNLKLIIGVLVVVLVVAVGIGAFFILRGANYSVDLSVPPGYTTASESEFKAMEDGLKSSESDAELDYMFVNEDSTRIIVVGHQDFFLEELPPDDPEGAEQYYYENKDEILEGFAEGFQQGLGTGADVDNYSVEFLDSGDATLHLNINVSLNQQSMAVDIFIMVKGNSMFLVIVQGLGNSNPGKTFDFIKQNISFE